MSRRLSVPHRGYSAIVIRPSDDGDRVLMQVGGYKHFLGTDQARRLADLLHDAADEVAHQTGETE